MANRTYTDFSQNNDSIKNQDGKYLQKIQSPPQVLLRTSQYCRILWHKLL